MLYTVDKEFSNMTSSDFKLASNIMFSEGGYRFAKDIFNGEEGTSDASKERVQPQKHGDENSPFTVIDIDTESEFGGSSFQTPTPANSAGITPFSETRASVFHKVVKKVYSQAQSSGTASNLTFGDFAQRFACPFANTFPGSHISCLATNCETLLELK
ncbi:hypothetical protein ABW20_dc0109201 [Dactylellina cionopaga]|nr:hypothetical protein ABW20_dc0109201 [Dactylellina cionopaga]